MFISFKFVQILYKIVFNFLSYTKLIQILYLIHKFFLEKCYLTNLDTKL